MWFDDFALLQFLTANFSENVSSHSVQALPESHMDGCVRVCVCYNVTRDPDVLIRAFVTYVTNYSPSVL